LSLKRLVLIALVGAAVGLSGCGDKRAHVVFENKSECGTIKVRLTNTETNEYIEAGVDIGERKSIEVVPGVYYDYLVDFTAAGRTADDFRCVALEEGKVMVPAGAEQVFALESQKQTAVPTSTP